MRARCAVQPHVCGERKGVGAVAHRTVGSAPRVWGTQRRTRRHAAHRRFRPTCVGNACARCAVPALAAVQPHVCGERAAGRVLVEFVGGSAPRVWGTPAPGVAEATQWRFSPTCVGNAEMKPRHHSIRTVQPHVCGERLPWVAKREAWCGSAPRVWGTLTSVETEEVTFRFSPTCVGNASTSLITTRCNPVQPHVCGERSDHLEPGSAPRVWGTRRLPLTPHALERFSPTCVGNAISKMRLTIASSVQPHVCGERG
ncbi:hypothetical protein SAMN05444161_4728 [Rhizobiales bacterium GAS191]|nr:hypothetical protein SAMN05444161_4728 [Rhizobiales bacterium GAS191]